MKITLYMPDEWMNECVYEFSTKWVLKTNYNQYYRKYIKIKNLKF